jgi:hypothetical protein
MTADLRELLEELAAGEPAPAPGLAERAWAGGRRRRRRSRLQVAVAAAAALALVALVTPGLPASVGVPQFAGRGAAGVEGYPERIGRQWWIRELPDRPGPVAAVLESSGSWYAVRADGHRWRLPGRAGLQVPALSRDGRMLGYLAGVDGPYVLHDLVDGRREVLQELYGGGRRGAGGPHQLGLGSLGRWSPDGRRLLLAAAQGMLLVDAANGQVRHLSPSHGLLMGWVGDDRIAWLGASGPGGNSMPLAIGITDLRGTVESTVPLRGSEGLSVRPVALRLDGSEMALLIDKDELTDEEDMIRFRLPSGTLVQERVQVEASVTCGFAYSPQGTLVLSVTPPSGQHATVMEVTTAGVHPFTAVAPSVQAHCVHWASDALVGPARGGGLLGTNDAAWTWWWREILLAAVGLVAAAAFLRRHPVRLPRRRPSAPPDVSWYG